MEQAVDGRLVNWHTHTLTFIPSLELRYRRPFGPVTITLTSAYTYFATTPIARSTEAYSFTSESQVWSNRVELGVMTPWSVARWPVLVGGFFERTDLWGGLRESLKADYVHAVGGHVALDPGGRLWKMSEIGVAASYFWSGSFSGLDTRPRLGRDLLTWHGQLASTHLAPMKNTRRGGSAPCDRRTGRGPPGRARRR